ncbi:hypothetical protein PSCICG_15330 [Pseudomonas cichorii]|nr:hypothetical protein PSCICG_15330 [Pseudomonas cichorii]
MSGLLSEVDTTADFRQAGSRSLLFKGSNRLMKEEIQKQIAGALEELFGAVSKLQTAYPGKPFTLDGRLVGDIGEVVASLHYRIKLNEGLTKHHDAVCDDGRNVQIKTTFPRTLHFL